MVQEFFYPQYRMMGRFEDIWKKLPVFTCELPRIAVACFLFGCKVIQSKKVSNKNIKYGRDFEPKNPPLGKKKNSTFHPGCQSPLRIIIYILYTFLVGDPYKPSPLLLGGG